MTTPTEIQTTVQITKVSDADGREGPQWELTVKWPWMPPGARYGDTLWLDVSDFPEKPAIAVHNVIAVKGTIKGTKAPNPAHDGSKDWMWNWRILSLDIGTIPEPPAHLGHMPSDEIDNLFTGKPDSPSGPKRPNPGVDPEEAKWDAINAIKDEKIAKARAFNAAVAFMVSPDYPHEYKNDILGDIPSHLQELWHRIYWDVVKRGVQPEGWCFDHDVPRRKTKDGTYVHELGDQWCTGSGLFDAAGDPVEGE